MRCIMVGTAYIQSTRCSSTSASAASGSKRGITTTWFPVNSAATEKESGPLWYSGPVARCTPSVVMPNPAAVSATDSVTAAPPATISFGRPVLPPEVGAFHAFAAFGGSGASESSGSGSNPAAHTGAPFGLEPDHERGVGELDDRVELGAGEAGRDRLWRRAELPGRDRRFEPLDAVRAGRW